MNQQHSTIRTTRVATFEDKRTEQLNECASPVIVVNAIDLAAGAEAVPQAGWLGSDVRDTDAQRLLRETSPFEGLPCPN